MSVLTSVIPRRLLGPSLHICVAACYGEQDAALQSYPDLERASRPLGGGSYSTRRVQLTRA